MTDPHAEASTDYWREKAFDALATLKQANDNCERLSAREERLRELLLALLDAGIIRGDRATKIRAALSTPEADE